MISSEMPALTSYTAKLTPSQGKALEHHLRSGKYELRDVPYARVAGSTKTVNVVYYESGKLVVQGKGTQEFVEFILEPEILKEARLGYEEQLNPEILLPRIGVDESGKGDFFGPMCVAGVYINESVVRAWKDSGIRDSKKIGSDKRMAELAEVIRTTPGCVFTVVPIGNEAYNRLHKKLRSTNAILAWGHARVIENLMGLRYQMNPAPVRAISDQFSHDKGTIEKALMSLGREIEFVQRHKAESDLAVAAASILARDEFVQRLGKMGSVHGLDFPKGASAEVEKVGRDFVAKFGPESLPKVAKMHFRTSFRVLGLPEPPKVEWEKPKPRPARQGGAQGVP